MAVTEIDTEEQARAAGYDHVRVAVDGVICGWRGLGKTGYAMNRCPKCRAEVYALAVFDGRCAKCGFDINHPAPTGKEQDDEH